jgi:hypothetical protein
MNNITKEILPTYFGVLDEHDLVKPSDNFVYTSIEHSHFDVHCNDEAVKAVLENIGCSFRTVQTVQNACTTISNLTQDDVRSSNELTSQGQNLKTPDQTFSGTRKKYYRCFMKYCFCGSDTSNSRQDKVGQ